MNSGMQRRLYEMEVTPPQAVWEKLSLNIDEINEDNLIANKVLNAELTPPVGIWEKINSTINDVTEEKDPVQKKGIVIKLRRLAAAAVFIGIIAAAWILLRNNNKPTGIAGTENQTQEQTLPNTNTTQENKNPNIINSPLDKNLVDKKSTIENLNTSNSQSPIVSVPVRKETLRIRNHGAASRSKNNRPAEPAIPQYAVLDAPLNKSFDQPIDDLSLVTSDQNYLTMVNANGRLAKIPTQLASLAPHLQDKPVSEDYYEVMFGEGAYWKETLNEWRKKVVSAPLTSGDAFTSLVELLKNVQSR